MARSSPAQDSLIDYIHLLYIVPPVILVAIPSNHVLPNDRIVDVGVGELAQLLSAPVSKVELRKRVGLSSRGDSTLPNIKCQSDVCKSLGIG